MFHLKINGEPKEESTSEAILQHQSDYITVVGYVNMKSDV